MILLSKNLTCYIVLNLNYFSELDLFIWKYGLDLSFVQCLFSEELDTVLFHCVKQQNKRSH
jgi:hypothetical protein